MFNFTETQEGEAKMEVAIEEGVVVGRDYFYKLSKTRGRPFVGRVVRKAGIFVEVENLRSGEKVRINPSKIGKPYEFKPYNKKAEDLEVA